MAFLHIGNYIIRTVRKYIRTIALYLLGWREWSVLCTTV